MVVTIYCIKAHNYTYMSASTYDRLSATGVTNVLALVQQSLSLYDTNYEINGTSITVTLTGDNELQEIEILAVLQRIKHIFGWEYHLQPSPVESESN